MMQRKLLLVLFFFDGYDFMVAYKEDSQNILQPACVLQMTA